jgi:hypothetical protein
MLRGYARKNELQRQAWDARRQQRLEGLAGLSDEELIAAAEARTSLSHPYREMEMQRRLKAAIEDLTAESARARRSAFWIGAILVALTMVLVALTVVLAVRA